MSRTPIRVPTDTGDWLITQLWTDPDFVMVYVTEPHGGQGVHTGEISPDGIILDRREHPGPLLQPALRDLGTVHQLLTDATVAYAPRPDQHGYTEHVNYLSLLVRTFELSDRADRVVALALLSDYAVRASMTPDGLAQAVQGATRSAATTR